jgi:hypothetical protein
MQVAIPHALGREEVRRRLRSRSHELADQLPGMAQVDTSWPSEDRMDMAISAMGQSMTGHIDIQDSQVVFDIAMPAMLSFIEPVIEGAIRQQGTKLLAPPAP